MKTKEESTKMVNFMKGVFVLGHGHVVKMQYFFSCLLWGMDHTIKVYSIDNQGRVYQIVNFMTPCAGLFIIGRGRVSL